MSDEEINQAIETFSIQNLPELENEYDSYIVRIDRMGVSIFQKSKLKATSYESHIQENDKIYGEYDSRDELAGAFETIVAEMLAQSRNRVDLAKQKFYKILRKTKEDEDSFTNKQSFGALRNSLDVKLTDREAENAIKALLEKGSIKEVEDGDAGRQFVIGDRE